jgi:hypothetical protein
MNVFIKKIFPMNPSRFEGYRLVRLITALFLLVIVVRSCVHLFSADGGAQSIAGIDTDVEGGNNIIAIFHQWGASQLLTALVLWVLFFKYPGLTPLILLALAVEPLLRSLSGQILPVESLSTPPGEALNWPVFFVICLVFVSSLIKPRKNGEYKEAV